MYNKKPKTKSTYNNEKLPLSGNLYKKNKRRISFAKLFKLVFASVAFLSLTFIVIYVVFLNNKTNAESVNQGTVLTQLSKNFVLPEEEVVSMMRVSNAKELSSQDTFYKNVKNGDYIIVYKSMVIIYNFDKNLVENVRTY